MSMPNQPPRVWARLLPQLVKFGLVGAVGFVVNVVVFNALRVTVFDPAVLHNGPLYATIVATIVAVGANWLGNRYWAFSGQRRRNATREGVEFFVVSLAAMAIPLACVWVSHYLLGFTSLLADNIATNVVGLALGTAFRFALYRYWVFSPARTARPLDTTARPVPPASEPATTAADVTSATELPLPGRERLPGAPDRGLIGEG